MFATSVNLQPDLYNW